MSTESYKKICNSDELKPGGTGVKCIVKCGQQRLPLFAIRYENEVFAYLNRCAHLMLELDWDDGEFFDASGEYLICANHGALFEPQTGLCVNGPCYGASLTAVSVSEVDSVIVLNDATYEIETDSGNQ